MVTQHTILDMTPGTKPVVNVSQYDTGARTLVFHLRQNRQTFTPPEGCTAILHGIKPDSTYFSYAAEIDGDTVVADCTEQMTACVGFAECEVRLSNSEGHVGSANFLLNCEKSPMNGAIISDTDIPVFEQLATRAEQAAATAISAEQDATASAEAAAESASAASISETNAAALATAAATSAEEAGESATAAAESASSASGSEASARGFAEQAEQSATNAENSAQGAAQDAQTASAKAEEAAASANRASGSAVDSANAANLASGYADTAQAQAQAAEGSANSAAGSALTATTAAATATEKAGEASQSASAAGILADSAAASASAASASAGTASEKATEAGESAINAANSASAAAGSASDASDSAAAALVSEQAAAQSASDIAASAEQIQINTDNIADLEDRKASIDGYYEEMTVGDAEQLISSQYVEDSTPYLFRTTGGSADVGNREYLEKIVGGTVAWNQLIQTQGLDISKTQNGVTIRDNRDGTYTVSTDANGASAFVYLALSNRNIDLAGGHKYLLAGTPSNGGSSTFYWYLAGSSVIYDYGNGVIYPATASILVTPVIVYVKQGTVITTPVTFKPQCFDLTAMFGSTIADYIYSLEQSTAGAGVAFFRKLFPEDYYPYDAGTLKSVEGVSAHQMVGFNQYNPATGTAEVLGGNQYQITGAYTALSLDGETITPDSNGLFTPSANGTLTVTGGDDSTTCVHLVWSGTRNGEYEPYVKHTYPLDSSLTLRGIPKLDASNNLYYDGDEYGYDGTVTRKYGIRAYQTGDESLADAITDGTNTVYKLTTPTTETAEPYQQIQICDDWGTEEFVSTGMVPVGHDTEYPANLRDKLQHLPDLASSDGRYIVRQSGSQMSLEAFPIPTPPTDAGTYTLKATVSGGTPTYTWEVEA